MKTHSLLTLTLLFSLSTPATLWAKKKNLPQQEIFGVVHHCHDGDTCTVIRDEQKISVRFSGVDTPELAQKDGRMARDFTESLVKGKEVRLLCDGKSFNRVTCTVFLNDLDINAELVRAGFAFDVPQFSGGKYQGLMASAQAQKIGIWKDDPISPFCFRHRKHKVCRNNPTFVGK